MCGCVGREEGGGGGGGGGEREWSSRTTQNHKR